MKSKHATKIAHQPGSFMRVSVVLRLIYVTDRIYPGGIFFTGCECVQFKKHLGGVFLNKILATPRGGGKGSRWWNVEPAESFFPTHDSLDLTSAFAVQSPTIRTTIPENHKCIMRAT